MIPFTVIKTLQLKVLNNAEYLAFMKHVLSLLPTPSEEADERPGALSLRSSLEESGLPNLGLTADFIKSIQQDIDLLTDAVDKSRVSQETEIANENNKLREMTLTYITTSIINACKSPLEADSIAGNSLYKVIKPYIGAARLPVSQKTVNLQGLLTDLRKEDNAANITKLRLDTYLTELETANNSYISITTRRLQSRAANQREKTSKIRERLNEMYETLALLVQSHNIVSPTEETKSYVNNLNQLITETITAYNHRSKRPKSSEEETPSGERDERPGEL